MLYARAARLDLAQNVFKDGHWGRYAYVPQLIPDGQHKAHALSLRYTTLTRV